jgi:hypothetical protein
MFKNRRRTRFANTETHCTCVQLQMACTRVTVYNAACVRVRLAVWWQNGFHSGGNAVIIGNKTYPRGRWENQWYMKWACFKCTSNTCLGYFYDYDKLVFFRNKWTRCARTYTSAFINSHETSFIIRLTFDRTPTYEYNILRHVCIQVRLAQSIFSSSSFSQSLLPNVM